MPVREERVEWRRRPSAHSPARASTRGWARHRRAAQRRRSWPMHTHTCTRRPAAESATFFPWPPAPATTRYEREFFLNVVNGHGIVSWGAVDTSRSDDRRDEIIGFVTTRMIAAKDSEIEDLFRYNSSHKDLTLVYILTLGVVDSYRNLGIASTLVREVVKYAASISNCRGVYLHVISYNQPAISFYKKMLFKLVRRLPMFYYIRGQHYDSYLFVYYVNGGRSPCSPLEIVTSFVVDFRAFVKMLVAKFWYKEDHWNPRWARCQESNTLLAPQSNNRIISGDNTRCHV